MSSSVMVDGEQSETRIPSDSEEMDAHTLPSELDAQRTVAAKKSGIPSHHRPRTVRREVRQTDAVRLPKVLLEI
jgi:hypothetical protein